MSVSVKRVLFEAIAAPSVATAPLALGTTWEFQLPMLFQSPDALIPHSEIWGDRRNARGTAATPPGPSGSYIPSPATWPRSLIPFANLSVHPLALPSSNVFRSSIPSAAVQRNA